MKGGELRLSISDKHNGTYPFWRIDASNDDLRFGPTEKVRVTFTDDGKVGIGTTSPVANLHVGKQEDDANTPGTVARLAIQPYGHTGGPWIIDARDTATDAFLDLRYGTVFSALTVEFDAATQKTKGASGW